MNPNEKDLSAKQHPSQADARISYPHEYDSRPRRPQATSGQGAQDSNRTSSTQTSTTLTSTTARRLAFPKSARLLARRDFLFLQKRGKRRHCPHFVVLTAPARQPWPRLGVTVSRRFGKAVVRNRMKRMLREFFRQYQVDIIPAQDIVIIPKAGAETLSFSHIVEELGRELFIARKAI
jgi:ribonuclease P protein component